MAKLSPLDFIAKWQVRFAPNTTFNIAEADLQEFATDVADSFGVSVVNVPEYMPGIPYTVGFLVRFTPASGKETFYYARKAGTLAAPGPGNLVEWKEMPPPPLPTELSQSLTLVQAQGLDRTGVVAGRDYLINCGSNTKGDLQVVTVRGVSNECFDVEGTLEVAGVRTAVTDFNVQAGTWQVKTSYTDQQARAAQLNRVAAAGTTSVTLTAEAPFDYGTAASGTFAVNAFGCVVGKLARFAVGAGATAPSFTNAPSAQPFKYLGASYVSGRAFSYSLLVCADRIEVITLED